MINYRAFCYLVSETVLSILYARKSQAKKTKLIIIALFFLNHTLPYSSKKSIFIFLTNWQNGGINKNYGKINYVCLTIFGFVCPQLMGSIYF